MKKLILLACLFLFCFLNLFAQAQNTQNPLIGTWMETADPRGYKELKIITPTHVMFMVLRQKAAVDSFAFAGYGTYTTQNNKYTENIEVANFTWDKSKKLQFDYRVEGDKFYQKGIMTNADGTTENIDHVFTRVKLTPQQIDAIGTWELVSYQETKADGTIEKTDNTQMKLIRVINPTHYMQIGTKPDGTFIFANAGTHKKENNKIIVKETMSSSPEAKPDKIELTLKVEGDKLIEAGTNYYANGTQVKWSDVLKKVNVGMKKVASSSKK